MFRSLLLSSLLFFYLLVCAALFSRLPFPTRRSSDLTISTIRDATTYSIGSIYEQSKKDLSPHKWSQIFLLLRSEEHTSELQSRGQLVCRLLLEKKNIYNL